MVPESAHILLVDDDEGFRYAAAKALRNCGFEVIAAADYRDALTTLESDKRVDLLLTDVIMPDRIHGFALARMARMRRSKLKVLYLSAYDIPTSEATGKVLRKPISDAELLAEVRLALAS
jgi:CheY-like chemotaxis protein